MESTARAFDVASSSWKRPPEALLCATIVPILAQHIIYQDPQIIAGLSRYPSSLGHSLAVIRAPEKDLSSLDPEGFLSCMLAVFHVAEVLQAFYKVARCALVTDGGNSLNILPLHGLSAVWEPVTSNLKEFHEHFPGYVSSKDGPQMDASRLEDVCSRIQQVSGTTPPYDTFFDGDQLDQNLFARIIRGELSQSRVWEDGQHVAFLTPFANTPGFTVLVPRTHLSSDIFKLNVEAYSSLVRAAYTVAQILKKTFGLRRCGMIFEGFEVDYAHVKLIPIHEAEHNLGNSSLCPGLELSTYEEKYPGYVTSLSGPLAKDMEALSRDASRLRAFNPASNSTTIFPPLWMSSVPPEDPIQSTIMSLWATHPNPSAFSADDMPLPNSQASAESVHGFANDQKLSAEGQLELILQLTRLLEEAGTPCCLVHEPALWYFGAKRLINVSASPRCSLHWFTLILAQLIV